MNGPVVRPAPERPEIALPFPRPGAAVVRAYKNLHLALEGTGPERKALGDQAALPRPFDPPSCLDPGLRGEVWQWLDQVVAWVNVEYAWGPDDVVPPCWPQHPWLVHETACLADMRFRAGLALDGDAMEEWHRYALPDYWRRMRDRLKGGCSTKHEPSPARTLHTRHAAPDVAAARSRAFMADLASTAPPVPVDTSARAPEAATPAKPKLRLVDVEGIGQINPDTGEIVD